MFGDAFLNNKRCAYLKQVCSKSNSECGEVHIVSKLFPCFFFEETVRAENPGFELQSSLIGKDIVKT